jgi:hypothetical protein
MGQGLLMCGVSSSKGLATPRLPSLPSLGASSPEMTVTSESPAWSSCQAEVSPITPPPTTAQRSCEAHTGDVMSYAAGQ